MALDKKLLFEILHAPTAPYREQRVKDLFVAQCERDKVPYFEDPIGNIVLGVNSKENYLKLLSKKTSEPVRMFIAHLDHPGFHGTGEANGNLKAKWFGGAPRQHLIGASVWLCEGNESEFFKGEIVAAKTNDYTIETLQVKPEREIKNPRSVYGGFDFGSFAWEEGNCVYTKAADDLVGAFAIYCTARKIFKKDKSAPFLGLLSRAEEVGFIGTIGHLNLGWWKKGQRPLMAVSLETSRTLPGAIVGKGPVVRLGDRATSFWSEGLEVLTQIAKKRIPNQMQRRVMDGGTCEATAATVFGIPSIGISIPLGNYHNQSFEGGPKSRGELGPAPEFVNLTDVEGMLSLCEGIMEKGLPWQKPWDKKMREFMSKLKAARSLLASGSKI